jgi:hypothetical protein
MWVAYPIPPQRDGDWRLNPWRLIDRDFTGTRTIATINVGLASAQAYVSEARR